MFLPLKIKPAVNHFDPYFVIVDKIREFASAFEKWKRIFDARYKGE